MNVHIRVTAAVLVPLLALAPSCVARNREVRFQTEDGETVVHVPESGGQPVEMPEAELWSSVRVAARELRAPADPLAFAQLTLGLTEASGTYWYYPRSGLLVPGLLGGGLEEVDGPAEGLTRGYLEWCGGTRLGGGDCLRLLGHRDMLTLHGRYVVTLVMAMTASFGPMLDSLKELADPNAVAVMLASAAAMYILLLLIPEPISKLISLAITGALIGYLGLDMFWSLVYGARALAKEVDAATDFSHLRTAATNFGKVLGPQMGQLLILLVSHSLGKGLAAKGKAPPPRYAEATAQAQKLTRGHLGGAAAGVRSVTLDSGVITIGLTSGALMIGAPSGTGAGTGPQNAGGRSQPGETAPPDTAKRHRSGLTRQTVEQLQKSKTSLEKLIQEHRQKLADYKRDPFAFDNKGVLRNAPEELRQRIIEGRIDALEKQIAKQEGELRKVTDLLGGGQ